MHDVVEHVQGVGLGHTCTYKKQTYFNRQSHLLPVHVHLVRTNIVVYKCFSNVNAFLLFVDMCAAHPAKGMSTMWSPSWHRLPASLRAPVNMKMTLCGGQCFRWFLTPRNTYVGVIQHRAYELRECVARPSVDGRKVSRRCASVNDSDATVVRYIEFRRLDAPSWQHRTGASTVSSSSSSSTSSTSCANRRSKVHVHVVASAISSSCTKETQARGRTLDMDTLEIPAPCATGASDGSIDAEYTDDDVSFLTWYLSLEVDVVALWRRWTVDNTARDHPLVRYLISQLPPPSSTSAFASHVSPHKKSTRASTSSQADSVMDKKRHMPPASACVPMRHLRQDLHETLFAFLCSQNNHVKRITAMIDALCTGHGDYLCSIHRESGAVCGRLQSPSLMRRRCGFDEADGKSQRHTSDGEGDWVHLYSFPTLHQLARVTEESLRDMGFGYRSRYICSCARVIATSSNTKVESSAPACATAVTHGDVRDTIVERADMCESDVRRRRQHGMCWGVPFYEQLLSKKADASFGKGAAGVVEKHTLNTTRRAAMREGVGDTDDELVVRQSSLPHAVSSCAERRSMLMSLPGVGRKVADCVLLFALGHGELVPVDTHMTQIAATYLSASAGTARRRRPDRLGEMTTNTMQRRDGTRQAQPKQEECDEPQRRRRKGLSCDTVKDNTTGDSASLDWERTLSEWASRARVPVEPTQLLPHSARATGGRKRSRTPPPSRATRSVSAGASAEPPTLTMPLPALNDRVHDAVQEAFRALFGSSCGLAHSVLFYDRMRKTE